MAGYDYGNILKKKQDQGKDSLTNQEMAAWTNRYGNESLDVGESKAKDEDLGFFGKIGRFFSRTVDVPFKETHFVGKKGYQVRGGAVMMASGNAILDFSPAELKYADDDNQLVGKYEKYKQIGMGAPAIIGVGAPAKVTVTHSKLSTSFKANVSEIFMDLNILDNPHGTRFRSHDGLTVKLDNGYEFEVTDGLTVDSQKVTLERAYEKNHPEWFCRFVEITQNGIDILGASAVRSYDNMEDNRRADAIFDSDNDMFLGSQPHSRRLEMYGIDENSNTLPDQNNFLDYTDNSGLGLNGTGIANNSPRADETHKLNIKIGSGHFTGTVGWGTKGPKIPLFDGAIFDLTNADMLSSFHVFNKSVMSITSGGIMGVKPILTFAPKGENFMCSYRLEKNDTFRIGADVRQTAKGDVVGEVKSINIKLRNSGEKPLILGNGYKIVGTNGEYDANVGEMGTKSLKFANAKISRGGSETYQDLPDGLEIGNEGINCIERIIINEEDENESPIMDETEINPTSESERMSARNVDVTVGDTHIRGKLGYQVRGGKIPLFDGATLDLTNAQMVSSSIEYYGNPNDDSIVNELNIRTVGRYATLTLAPNGQEFMASYKVAPEIIANISSSGDINGTAEIIKIRKFMEAGSKPIELNDGTILKVGGLNFSSSVSELSDSELTLEGIKVYQHNDNLDAYDIREAIRSLSIADIDSHGIHFRTIRINQDFGRYYQDFLEDYGVHTGDSTGDSIEA